MEIQMPRRFLLDLAIVATLLAACGGTPAAPALTDPKEILTRGTSSLQGLKTVHIKAALSGKFDSGLATGSTSGTQVDLTGSTLEGDIDVADSETHIAVAVPALLAFSADILATGGTAYVKTSLNADGKYRKLDLTALKNALPIPSAAVASGSPDPSAANAMIAQLKAELDKLPAPTKLPDEKIGDQDVYHVQEKINSSDIPQASGALNGATGTLTVDVWTRKSDYRPARLVILVDGGAQGSLTLTIDLTAYDAPVTVTPPAADLISDQPFSFPGLPAQP
jgi:hypothetical protein